MKVSDYLIKHESLIVSIAAVILSALSAFVYGYEYGITPNHIQSLPFIAKIHDPSLFPNDYFVNTLSRFPSVYTYIMAYLSNWINLEMLHLVLYFVFKFALFIFAYQLACFLFRSRRTGIITMFLFAFSPLINAYGLLGHDPFMKTSFYQTSAVSPLALAAILMFLRKKYMTAYTILACIYYINALIGNFLIILFIAASGYEYMRKRNFAEFKYIMRPALFFAALMIPGIVWLTHLNITNPAHAAANFPLYLKLWYTGHYFPSFFTAHQWYHFAVICIFFIIFFRKGFGRCSEKDTVRVFIYTLFAMWLFAALCAEILPVRSFILLQFLRSDVFFIVLGIIFAADYIRSLLYGKSLRSIAIGGLMVLALTEFSQPSYIEFILIALLLTEFELPIKNFLRKATQDPEGLFNLLWFFFTLAIVAFSAVPILLHKASPKMSCFLFFAVMLMVSGDKKAPQRFKNLVAALVLAAAVFAYIHIIEYRAVSMNFSNMLTESDADWKKVQLWARDNTPVSSVFIAPLNMNGFRVFSNRSVFFDWVDGAAMHWSAGFEYEWAQRLSRLGMGEGLTKDRAGLICGMGAANEKPIHRLIYENLTENDFRHIAEECGAGYVVEYVTRPLNFKTVYENATFRIYRIS
ncbi:MAG: DUF6798 domain-containing protein [Candidatus Omnitrophota bacterium]